MTYIVEWTFSQISAPLWECLEDIWTKGWVNQSINQSITDGGDCRTAPATPGLLKIGLGLSQSQRI